MWFCIQFNIFIGDNISYIQKTTLLNSIWYRYILKALHNSNTLLFISIKKYAEFLSNMFLWIADSKELALVFLTRHFLVHRHIVYFVWPFAIQHFGKWVKSNQRNFRLAKIPQSLPGFLKSKPWFDQGFLLWDLPSIQRWYYSSQL